MPTSVRLDAKTEKLLERLAKQKSQTKSEVIREAIEALTEHRSTSSSGASAYEAIKDLVGCVKGGPADLSIDTGRKFKDMLRKKHKEAS
jgi:predicted DNA-binding protein